MIAIARAAGMSLHKLTRAEDSSPDVAGRVQAILEDVKARGDAAVKEYTKRFDGVDIDTLQVSAADIEAAYQAAEPYFVETLEQAALNIRAFHEHQTRPQFELKPAAGIVLGQRVTALERVGLYIPGGTAAYPSSVLMNAIPAQIAGVPHLSLVSPPGPDGQVNAGVMVAARVLGLTTLYRMGGAQAVAALAFGTESVQAVDKIVGPGNVYVATAKRLVYGTVAIDMIAGPSEILIIADEGANPIHVAADLLSQAEHDRLAAAILVTPSEPLAQAVQMELERQIPLLSRQEIARASIDNHGYILLVDSLEEAMTISNKIAPEHLELAVEDPFAMLEQVRNAGSVFVGRHVPEALGDYFAGPNHTLPTSGTARFSSPLSVEDFQKTTQYLSYSKAALAAVSARVVDFANREGLTAHGRSVAVRGEER